MKPMTLEQIKAAGPRKAILQRLCEKGIAEPEGIWELLEAQGVRATPGVIYQAISNHIQQKTSDEDRRERDLPDDEKGVTWKDVEMVALIAKKAGGIRQLMRFLTTMQRVPR